MSNCLNSFLTFSIVLRASNCCLLSPRIFLSATNTASELPNAWASISARSCRSISRVYLATFSVTAATSVPVSLVALVTLRCTSTSFSEAVVSSSISPTSLPIDINTSPVTPPSNFAWSITDFNSSTFFLASSIPLVSISFSTVLPKNSSTSFFVFFIEVTISKRDTLNLANCNSSQVMTVPKFLNATSTAPIAATIRAPIAINFKNGATAAHPAVAIALSDGIIAPEVAAAHAIVATLAPAAAVPTAATAIARSARSREWLATNLSMSATDFNAGNSVTRISFAIRVRDACIDPLITPATKSACDAIS